MDNLFVAVTAIGITPVLLIIALLVRNAGSARIVTFLPPGSDPQTAQRNRHVGNVLLALPIICGGLGGAALVHRELAGWLMALLVLLFLVVIAIAVVRANQPDRASSP
jgi:hypothetical protein